MKSIFYFKSKYLRDIIDYTKDLCNIPYHTKLSEFNPYLSQYSYDESLTCKYVESGYLSSELIDTSNRIYEIAPMLCLRNETLAQASLTISLPVCKKIGSHAFQNNYYGSISINLPNCEYFGSYCFSNRSMTGSISFSKCSYIGNYAFNKVTFPSSTNIVFDACSYIGDRAFGSAIFPSSTNLTLSASYIGTSAFAYAKNIIDITFLQSNVASYAFQGCSCSTFTATELDYIYPNAFQYCRLTSLNVSKIKKIGGDAFNQCFLTRLMGEVNYIYANGFEVCSKITRVSISNCNLIGSRAFYSCSNLFQATISGDFYIESSAFYSCYKLSIITLDGCTSIGLKAFYPWSNASYRSFYLKGSSVISLASYPFSIFNYIGATTFYIPSSMLSLYQADSYWCQASSRFSVMED